MTVPRSTNIKRWLGPTPGNPHLFPKTVRIITHALAYEITQSIKANYTIF